MMFRAEPEHANEICMFCTGICTLSALFSNLFCSFWRSSYVSLWNCGYISQKPTKIKLALDSCLCKVLNAEFIRNFFSSLEHQAVQVSPVYNLGSEWTEHGILA